MKKIANYQSVSLSVVLILLVMLAGCITTKNYRGPIDKKKSEDNYVQLGMAYFQQNNRDAARRNFERALAIDSDSAQANNGMALLYQMNGEFELAEKYFLKAISADDNYTQAQSNYGTFLYQQMRYPEAYDVFEELTQDLSYGGRAYALSDLGLTALKLGKRDEAKSIFRRSLNIDNKVSTSTLELAEIYFDEKNYVESKRYLHQYSLLVTRHSPRSLWLGIRIGRIFGDKDKEASYALALKNLYPYSDEYLQYKTTLVP
jgi:type IV pilus assembly protein PilF